MMTTSPRLMRSDSDPSLRTVAPHRPPQNGAPESLHYYQLINLYPRRVANWTPSACPRSPHSQHELESEVGFLQGTPFYYKGRRYEIGPVSL